MVWFIDKLELIGSPTNIFNTVDIMTVLVLSAVLCFIAALTYKYTHDGISYSPSFVQTTVMFGVLVSTIMLIIGSNIARAFTLVGALSIIRFRNAIKSTRDVGFIFFMMTIGMAVGTRFYGLAVILTIFICLLVIGMVWFDFGSKKDHDEVLKIIAPSSVDSEKTFEKVFEKYLKFWNLINTEDLESTNLNELVYIIRFKKSDEKPEFVKEIKRLNSRNRVSIFGSEHLIY